MRTSRHSLLVSIQWRHNERDSVSNRRRLDYLLIRLFRRRSNKKIKAPRHWPFVRGIHRWPLNFPHKGPVTRRMFPFGDVIMYIQKGLRFGSISLYGDAGPRLNIRKDVFSQDLVKSRSHEIGTLNCHIALKFDRHIGSNAAEVPVKFQSDRTILNTNLAASRLYEILRKDVFSDIETGPWCWY